MSDHSLSAPGDLEWLRGDMHNHCERFDLVDEHFGGVDERLDFLAFTNHAQKPIFFRQHEMIARGRELYKRQCQSCHGETGTGDGPIAERLGFSPGDLTDAEAMGGQTDGEIFWKIATGRDAMPGFKTVMGLDDQQIWDLVNHTRSLAIRPKVKNDE